MKKMVSFISALAMCAVMTAPIASSAAEVNQDSDPKTSTVTFTSEIPSSYKVVIPDGEVDLETPSELTISAENVMIADGEVLDISVKSANNWKLVDQKEGSSAALTYTLTPENETALSGEEPVSVLSVEAGTISADVITKKMTAEVTDTPVKSGTYKDILTFMVSVNEQQAENNDSLGGETQE